MSSMFGKPRATSSAVDRHLPSLLPECNVAILGCRGSGKSALTVKFLTKRFISEYDPDLGKKVAFTNQGYPEVNSMWIDAAPTHSPLHMGKGVCIGTKACDSKPIKVYGKIPSDFKECRSREDTYTSEETVDQQLVLMKVMDTADQDTPVNCERYLSWANAFMVVYSIDNKRSFEGCHQYLDIISLHSKGSQHDYPILLLGNKLDMEQYRQVTKAEGVSLAATYGCLFYEVSACLEFEAVQHVFHEAVREVRREMERNLPARPLFITEERPFLHLASPTAVASKHGVASCTLNTLSTVNYKEIPSVAQAKLVTVKSSRAQSKRKAPTLTLLKGFKIF